MVRRGRDQCATKPGAAFTIQMRPSPLKIQLILGAFPVASVLALEQEHQLRRQIGNACFRPQTYLFEGTNDGGFPAIFPNPVQVGEQEIDKVFPTMGMD